MKSIYELSCKCSLLFICIFCLVGCSVGKQKDQQCNVSKDDEVLITIGEIAVKTGEVMPYLLQVKKEFEQLGGEDVWDHNDFSGGKKAEDVAKLGVLDNIIRTKILVGKSTEMGITITDDEKSNIESQALNYYDNLDQADIEDYNLTKESIINSFMEYGQVNKVIFDMTKDYVPKDEELQKKFLENSEYQKLLSSNVEELLINIKTRHIFFKTHEKNDNGELIPISPNIENETMKLAEEVYNKAISGGDFVDLVDKYSQDETTKEQDGECIIPIRIVDERFYSLKNLEPEDISPIIQGDYGYHIFKIIEILYPTQDDIEQYQIEFNDYETKLNEQYKEQLKNDAFNKIYDEWKKSTVVELNEELWARIDIFGKINENPISDKNIE